jgi:hypothetical protein
LRDFDGVVTAVVKVAACLPLTRLTRSDDAGQRFGEFAGDLGAFLGAPDGFLDEAGGLAGGFGGALGEVADFVGHHREALAVFAGAGGFDGGVEGEQVGLKRDLFDDLDDLADLTGGVVDRVMRLARRCMVRSPAWAASRA